MCDEFSTEFMREAFTTHGHNRKNQVKTKSTTKYGCPDFDTLKLVLF